MLYLSIILEEAVHTKLRKVGGSVMLAVPPVLLEILRLRPGATVDMGVERGRLVVDPQPRRRYSLDELLAQCDAKARRSTADREWLESPPGGGELL